MQIKMLASIAGLALTMPMAVQAQVSPGAQGRPQTGLSTQEYVMKASDGDMFEIESSRIALARSQTPAVRDHAQRMITEHTQTTSDLRQAIARSKSPDLRQPAQMTPAKQAMVSGLEKTDAADFDKRYLADQLTAHNEALAVHRGYAQSGQDPVLKMAAEKTAPLVEGHLNHLKAMTENK